MSESSRYFCPICHRLVEYDPYYGRAYCTFCSWRSSSITKKEFDIWYKGQIIPRKTGMGRSGLWDE